MRKGEIYNVKLGDVKDMNSALIVDVPYTKTKKPRQFVISDNFYSVCKKYMNLRPSTMTDKNQRFFINYQKGKCTKQFVGINKLGTLVQDIAKFLKLPHPETYTGHTYRRTSATIIADKTGDLLALKRHGGWQSNGTAEGYVNDSISKKIEISKHIVEAVGSTSGTKRPPLREKAVASTSGTKSPLLCETSLVVPEVLTEDRCAEQKIQNFLSAEENHRVLAPIHFHNCQNFTINFNQ